MTIGSINARIDGREINIRTISVGERMFRKVGQQTPCFFWYTEDFTNILDNRGSIEPGDFDVRDLPAECWDGIHDTSIGTDDHAKVLSRAVALGHL